jgi:DNA (cytosine-5)-methyltransferase 1
MGYHRAGFEVVGVDHNPQPHYPFRFWQFDVTKDVPLWAFKAFDAVHASPPCQAYTRKSSTWGRKRVNVIDHPDLLGPTRELLKATGLPYVIENVPGAPIDAQLMLCGTMFPPPGVTGKVLDKHRLFEANWQLPMPPAACNHSVPRYSPWSGKGRSAAAHRDAQGTPWIPTSGGASRAAGYTGDLNNAIPPAYTEHIGRALLAYLEVESEDAA